MKKLALLLLTLGYFAINMDAQKIKVNIGYQNFRSQQFDRLINYYNFSRPFLENEQALIRNGYTASISYFFNTERKINSGLTSGFSYTRSAAENNESKLAINFKSLYLGYLIHYSDKEHFKNAYAEFASSIIGGVITKREDGEQYTVDGERLTSYHIGGYFNLKVGYSLYSTNKLSFSPFIGLGYSPYFSVSDSEILINQTSSLVKQNSYSFYTFQTGLAVSF